MKKVYVFLKGYNTSAKILRAFLWVQIPCRPEGSVEPETKVACFILDSTGSVEKSTIKRRPTSAQSQRKSQEGGWRQDFKGESLVPRGLSVTPLYSSDTSCITCGATPINKCISVERLQGMRQKLLWLQAPGPPLHHPLAAHFEAVAEGVWNPLLLLLHQSRHAGWIHGEAL